MAGSRLRKDRHKGEAGQSLSKKRGVFRRFFLGCTKIMLAGAVATTIAVSGSNLKNLGPDYAMAGPAQKEIRKAEPEERKTLKKQALEAARAFRAYLIEGDSAQSAKFWNIYNSMLAGKQYNQYHAFTDPLLDELKRIITKDPAVKPLFKAYKEDQGRLLNFLWRNPAHYTDFLRTVEKIRATLTKGAAKDKDIAGLVALAKRNRGKKLKTPKSKAADMRRELRRITGKPEAEFWKIYYNKKHEDHQKMVDALDDAAINVLEWPARRAAAKFHGPKLTVELLRRMPKMQARICANVLREFLLTGDEKKYKEFNKIISTNPFSSAFKRALNSEFRKRISLDEGSGLKAVMDAYRARIKARMKKTETKKAVVPKLDPFAFVAMVRDVYKTATKGKATDSEAVTKKHIQEVEALRKRHGKDVVDPLLKIVARGMAKRGVRYLKEIIRTGSAGFERSFLNLFNGTLAMVARVDEKEQVQMPPAEDNLVFFSAFRKEYLKEMDRNKGLQQLHMAFRKKIVPIAVRDIIAELAKPKPDINRLTNDYGPELVNAVSSKLAKFSWLVRSPDELARTIKLRVKEDDKTATDISKMNKTKALPETYLFLVTAKEQRRVMASAGILDTMEKNLDKLTWITGTADDVEDELTRKANARDPVARQLLTKLRGKKEIGKKLLNAYRALSAIKKGRAGLEKAHGEKFIAYAEKNLAHLQWVLKPVDEVALEMEKRRKDPLLTSIFTIEVTTKGRERLATYPASTLAYALKDIYAELGKSSPDRSRLSKLYGPKLVAFVLKNRAKLRWAGGTHTAVLNRLLRPTKDVTIQRLKAGFMYSYTLVQFAPAIARARRGVGRGGTAKMDVYDAYGKAFLEPAFHREAAKTAPTGETTEHRALLSQCKAMEKRLEALYRHIKRYKVLKPVLPVLRKHILKWRDENDWLQVEIKNTRDPAKLKRFKDELKELNDKVITPMDLQYTLKLVFSVINLAQTGGDLKAGAATNAFTTSSDRSTLAAILGWYNGEEKTGKQPIIGEMAQAIMRQVYTGTKEKQKMFPEGGLYGFLSRMQTADYLQVIGKVYNAVKDKRKSTISALTKIYGPSFVNAVAAQATHLRVLAAGRITEKDFSMAQNKLYAAIVVRCYYALKEKKPGENRETMVKLFGSGFVETVEKNMKRLEGLYVAGAGLKEVQALPADLKKTLFAAYKGAYLKSIAPLKRLYAQQEVYLAGAMVTVYRTLARKPPSDASKRAKDAYARKVKELRHEYGGLVTLIEKNPKAFDFLKNGATAADLVNLRSDLLVQAREAFEKSDAAAKPKFMSNIRTLANRLPSIYMNLRKAMTFSNDEKDVATDLKRVVEEYDKVFGKGNDYLLRHYINIDLLNKSLPLIAKRYEGSLPPKMLERQRKKQPLLRNVGDLVEFLGSDQGRKIIREGKKYFTDTLKKDYLAWRTENSISQATGDLSDTNVLKLESQMSIIDALYLGIALNKVQTGSGVGKKTMVATMEALIVINNRDPYLVGPFLLQVLPAIIEVAKDERTIEFAMKAFIGLFTVRYGEATRGLAYSDMLNRKYFLKVFERIGRKLPGMGTVIDKTWLADELRRYPPPLATGGLGGTENPYLYTFKPGFWHPSEFFKPLSTPISTRAQPEYMTPKLVMPTLWGLNTVQYTTTLPIDSGATELYNRLRLYLEPPVQRMFRSSKPAYTKINTIGIAAITRAMTQLFGPMPKDTEAYWLSWDATAGGYYGVEGGDAGRMIGGAGLGAKGRTMTGGLAAELGYTYAGSEGTTEGAGTSRAYETGTHALSLRAQAANLPVVRMLNLELTHEKSGTKETTTTPEGETTITTPNSEKTKGTVQMFTELAKKKGVGMVVYFKGEHVPTLKGEAPEGGEKPVTQEGEGRMQGRILVIDANGNGYQFAVGRETERQLDNFMFLGAHHKNVMASLQLMGKEWLSDKGAAGGFNGAAIGFTIPTKGTDSFSTLAFGTLLRNISTMSPVAAQQAAGLAFTRLLESKKHRDVYALLYRGSESITTDPANPHKITSSKFSTAVGEFVWRRMSMSPGDYQFELRLAGGYPATAGVQFKYEWGKKWRRKGFGLTAAYSTVNLLHNYLLADAQATELYATTKNVLIGTYGWSENKARDTGWLVALNYMYSRMEDWVIRNPDGTYSKDKDKTDKQHYASAMLMYYAKKHGLLMGAQKVPGWGDMYTKIDETMQLIQRDPVNEATHLSNLATTMKDLMKKNIWRFSLGYGYDGQKVGVYIFGAAQWSDDSQTYAGLKSVFVFGRPAKTWVDLGAYAFVYPRVAIIEGEPETRNVYNVTRFPPTVASTYTVLTKQPEAVTKEYMDIMAGIGSNTWTINKSFIYSRTVTLDAKPDIGMALRDIYNDLGGVPDRARLRSSYGSGIVATVEKDLKHYSWLVRPQKDIQMGLWKRRKDLAVRTILRALPGWELGTKTVSRDDARLVRTIYIGLRTKGGKQRLIKRYGRKLVERISDNSSSLMWMLLPPDKARREFRKRLLKKGAPETKMAGMRMPTPPTKAQLTGTELKRLFERNMVDAIYACSPEMKTKMGIQSHRYEVVLGPHLKAALKEEDKGRSSTFYVLNTYKTPTPGKSKSLIIGNKKDLEAWIKQKKIFGADITRVKITQKGDKYTLNFSGDNRLRFLNTWRVFGGITLPLRASEYKGRFDGKGNFKVGALLRIMQSRKHDIILGGLFSRFTPGSTQWQQWTVTWTHRIRLKENSMESSNIYYYVFFNQLTKKMVVTSKDVFSNATELRDACRKLSDGTCDNIDDLKRTTGGLGVTWSKMSVNTGKEQKLNLYFEAGTQDWTPYSTGKKKTEGIFRAGVGYSQKTTGKNVLQVKEWGVGVTAWRGLWNIGLSGESPGLQSPVYLPTYVQGVRTLKNKGPWGIMVNATLRW